jgi:phage terminase large subunit
MHKVNIYLPDKIGKGYKSFWGWRGRYLVVKGSRGSKKSTTAALKIVYNIMKNAKTNALIIRRYYVTHRESTYAQLLWAINHLGVGDLWVSALSPLQLIYTPTGQRILFRGLDDPQSIASITIADGYLTYVWIEEAFQIEREQDFNKLDLSVRGVIPDNLYKQFILTFNPWDKGHWMKARFFDDESDPDVLTLTTNYQCNEWLGADDLAVFERLRQHFPRRYLVEGLGDWGISEGQIFDNWEVRDFDYREMMSRNVQGYRQFLPKYGLDYGFAADPTAFVGLLISTTKKEIYVYDEWYKHSATNKQIYDALRHKQYHKVRIKADSEDVRTTNELQILGLSGIVNADKGPDSVRAGINRLKDYKIIIHPRCVHTEVEFTNHCWDTDKSGRIQPKPAPDDFHHCIDAIRYATEDITSENFSF